MWLKTLFPEKDDLSELKSVTFMLLFVKCDFFAHVVKNESTVISNFWNQIVVSTANVVNKIFRNSGCAL